VLTPALFKKVMRTRRYRSIVVIDIAVPRDADPKIAKLDGVYLFDIDDLERVVASNLKERAKEAEVAGKLVDDEVEHFDRWLRGQRVVPTIRSLREHFLGVARAEVERTLKNLSGDSSPEQREQAVRRLGELIVNKLLHAPMTALKAGDEGDVDTLVAATHRLFPLDAGADHDEPAAIEAQLPNEQKSRGRA
jgi:glutamyl-tRNA reductase